ncbi:MAG: phage holin family protein [Phycicoccus sp.]
MSGTASDATGTRPQPSLRSVGELLGDISGDMSTLVRQEMALAKAEVKESASNAGQGVGLLVGAGVGGFLVLLFVSVSAWWGLGQFIGREWSALVVAAVWALIAAALANIGRSRLKQAAPLAPRTAETASHIPDALRGHES